MPAAGWVGVVGGWSGGQVCASLAAAVAALFASRAPTAAHVTCLPSACLPPPNLCPAPALPQVHKLDGQYRAAKEALEMDIAAANAHVSAAPRPVRVCCCSWVLGD